MNREEFTLALPALPGGYYWRVGRTGDPEHPLMIALMLGGYPIALRSQWAVDTENAIVVAQEIRGLYDFPDDPFAHLYGDYIA